ncbi:hypothetical protein ACFQ7A_16155, partial [Streptomyces sp. NPDC056528]
PRGCAGPGPKEVRGARLAALQTALMKASAEENLKRTLVFHGVIKEAEAFAAGLPGDGPFAPELSAAVRRSLGFGLPEEVVLPRGTVESLTVSVPEWLSGEHRDVEVGWRPMAAAPLKETSAGLVFLNGGQVTASYPSTLDHLGHGSIGRSVKVDLVGGNLQLMIPRTTGAPASMRFTFSLEGLEPTAALRLLRIRQRLVASGGFEVRTSEGAIGGGDLPSQSE